MKPAKAGIDSPRHLGQNLDANSELHSYGNAVALGKLHPDRQRLFGLRPKPIEYPQHLLGVEQPVPLDVFRDHKNSSPRHG